jgi:2-dehydropantoate 2-reductase
LKALIIGAGAIGCLIGGKLAQAGHEVTLAARPGTAAVIRQQGIELHDSRGLHHIPAVAAGSIAAALNAGAYDLAVLTVKSYDTAAALDEFVQAAGSAPPPMLSLQNGVGNEETLATALGDANVLAGVITTPVSVLGPAAIQVDKAAYALGLSPWQADVSASLVDTAQTALSQAGFAVTRYANAQSMKWTKLLMNMMGNAVCAILDMTPAQELADSVLVDLEIDAWREALAVMQAAGIRPANLGGYPFRLLAPLIRSLPKPLLRGALRAKAGDARGSKMPSLHIDLHSGRRKSEVAWLNGAIVRKGEEVGVRTPINRMLTDVLLRMIDDGERRSRWRHNHARILLAAEEYRSRSGNR